LLKVAFISKERLMFRSCLIDLVSDNANCVEGP